MNRNFDFVRFFYLFIFCFTMYISISFFFPKKEKEIFCISLFLGQIWIGIYVFPFSYYKNEWITTSCMCICCLIWVLCLLDATVTLGLVRVKGEEGDTRKEMAQNTRVMPNCLYASNPYHECTDACLIKMKEAAKPPKNKKGSG